MTKKDMRLIDLNVLALLLQEKDELIDSVSLLKREINSLIIDKEVPTSLEVKQLKDDNTSLRQELKNEKLKLEKYYQKFLSMESVYLKTIDKLKQKETIVSMVKIPRDTINKDVLKETQDFLKKLDVKV